jgi:hypothetical protein
LPKLLKLHALLQTEVDCVKKSNGMFSFRLLCENICPIIRWKSLLRMSVLAYLSLQMPR